MNLTNKELRDLERTNKKTHKSVETMRTIIRPNDDGILKDRDGQAYNEKGQKLDENGAVIPELIPIAVQQEQAAAAAAAALNAAGNAQGVDRHHQGIRADVNGPCVERHHQGVD